MARHEIGTVVGGTPGEVRARMKRALLEIRSLWFPSLREMRAWDAATSPLYLRWLGADEFEVGPRLVNQQAARFCPVWRGRLETTEDGRTRLVGCRAAPRMATGLLGGWVLLLAVWLAVEVPRILAADSHPGGLFWWLVAAVSTAGTAAMGRSFGGQALSEALPELWRVVEDPNAGADDWD